MFNRSLEEKSPLHWFSLAIPFRGDFSAMSSMNGALRQSIALADSGCMRNARGSNLTCGVLRVSIDGIHVNAVSVGEAGELHRYSSSERKRDHADRLT